MALPPNPDDYSGRELRDWITDLYRYLVAERLIISPSSGLKDLSSAGGRALTVLAGRGVHFLAPVGGIAARTGTGPYTPGSATCDIMQADGTDVDFTATAVIYNDSNIAVSANAEGWAIIGYDGRLYAITEYCPDGYY